jgi:apolipoprotein N-acyltransferase
MLSSVRWRDVGIAAGAAVALAAAFPKIGAAWLAPIGLAGLFWTWQGASWKRAAALGWFAGVVFFAIVFAWVGHTVGSYIGYFGPFLMFGPALYEAPFWALAAVLATIAYRRMDPALAPIGAAAAFTICEWLRSIGVLAVPFDQIGYSQADMPWKALAAYVGSFGLTFAVSVLAAYVADALHRRTWTACAAAAASIALLTGAAWLAWPARHLARPDIPVAAIQGNIAQSLKWNSLSLAVGRYSALTRQAVATHPRLIVWPETVIPIELNRDPNLLQYFIDLSREVNATIVAGSLEVRHKGAYNALYILQPSGSYTVYDKRALVPFAESFPAKRFLSWLPYVSSLNGGITAGTIDGVYPTTALPIAPLICWESAFADLAHAQLLKGAQLLVVSTDDAWFGTTSGPYLHAQISQLRAIESGAYVVRAAATGVSGIIAPDGTWQRRSRLEKLVVVSGNVGPRVPTVFARIGPTAVMTGVVLLYLLLLVAGVAVRRGAPQSPTDA